MRQEILVGPERRRRWSDQEKISILREVGSDGIGALDVARRHGISRQNICQWRPPKPLNLPDLKSEKGEHYADILGALYQRRLSDLLAEEEAEPAGDENGGINKSALALGAPKRVRNKDHLGFVASPACLVCGRTPSQAHHLRFAQPRALGRKVSDQWTMPLCRLHHGALRQDGNELLWWRDQRIDPLPHAEGLWRETLGEEPGVQSDDVPREAVD